MKTWQEEGFDSPEQQISVHAIRAKLKLQTGDYCEVTREQAIELLKIEHYGSPEAYCNEFFGKPEYPTVWARTNDTYGVTLSGMLYGKHITHIAFPDFKQRLINTVKK